MKYNTRGRLFIAIKGSEIVYDKMRGYVYHLDCGKDIIQATRAAKSLEQYGTDIY
jgi:hypothetical protein